MQAPKRLTGKAREKWNTISDSFNLTSPLDQELLCQYCESFGIYEQAKAELAKGDIVLIAPNHASYPNAAVAIMIKTTDQMRRIYKQLQDCIIASENIEEELI